MPELVWSLSQETIEKFCRRGTHHVWDQRSSPSCTNVFWYGQPHLASPCSGEQWRDLCGATCAAPPASSPPWLDWASTDSPYATSCRSCSLSWRSTCWGRGCDAPSSSTRRELSEEGQFGQVMQKKLHKMSYRFRMFLRQQARWEPLEGTLTTFVQRKAVWRAWICHTPTKRPFSSQLHFYLIFYVLFVLH